jgi:hypothetical protein
VERGVGCAFGRTGAFLNFYTMKVISVVSVILAQAAALVRTIHVVREEFAVSGRLAYRLAGLRGQRAIGKARRATAASLVRYARTTSGELLVEVDVVIARSRFFGIVFRRKVNTPLGQLIDGKASVVDAVELAERALQARARVIDAPQARI